MQPLDWPHFPRLRLSDLGAIFPGTGYPTAENQEPADNEEYRSMVTYLVGRSNTLKEER